MHSSLLQEVQLRGEEKVAIRALFARRGGLSGASDSQQEAILSECRNVALEASRLVTVPLAALRSLIADRPDIGILVRDMANRGTELGLWVEATCSFPRHRAEWRRSCRA
jgi:hypothetical protein